MYGAADKRRSPRTTMIRRDVLPPSSLLHTFVPRSYRPRNTRLEATVENGRSSSVVIRTERVQVQQLTYSELATSKLHLLEKSTLCQYIIHIPHRARRCSHLTVSRWRWNGREARRKERLGVGKCVYLRTPPRCGRRGSNGVIHDGRGGERNVETPRRATL